MTTSNDLADRTRDVVLLVAREVSHQEVHEDLDPLAVGFDSIATLELATRLADELGVPCSIEDVFETRSLGELAQTLAQRATAASLR